ncbi:MFS transporter [Streptomyces inhibens]|uniref:MFS transporter n=1 Tax=Streptomyces inhibens TaxID=2293571 RepID=UPI00368ED1DF
MTRPTPQGRSHARFLAVALCSATIVVDGYDLIVYGTVLPTLLGGGAEWTLSAAEAGRIGSYTLIGMLIGALLIGTVTDIFGRRRIMMACTLWFSAAMFLAAAAPNPDLFGLARLVAGVGLGGVVPTAIALTVEYAHPQRQNATNALMFSGYPTGGIVAALSAIWIIPEFGWRAMFTAGGALGLVLLPLMWFKLPESASYLLSRGRRAEAEALAARFDLTLEEPVHGTGAAKPSALSGLRTLFSGRYVVATLLFWVATGFGLLLVYGLNTWLAQIMRKAGYGLGSSLAFLIALNLGAIIGTPLLGRLADRVGAKKVSAGMFLTAAACIWALSYNLPPAVLYALVAVAGACTIGTTIIVNSYTATFYPAQMRATALGWSLGIGRLGAILGPLYGAFVINSGWGLSANFYAFAIPAALGMLVMLAIPAARRNEPTPELQTAGT